MPRNNPKVALKHSNQSIHISIILSTDSFVGVIIFGKLNLNVQHGTNFLYTFMKTCLIHKFKYEKYFFPQWILVLLKKWINSNYSCIYEWSIWLQASVKRVIEHPVFRIVLMLYVLYIYRSLQASVKRVIEHPVFRIVLMLLILLDFTLVIIDLAGSECSSDDTLENISHVIISLFLLEVFARLFYEG